MTFNISALNPGEDLENESFDINNFGWRPIAEVVLNLCGNCLLEREKKYWHTNDGQIVSEESAVKIGKKLKKLDVYSEFADFCIDSGGFQIW